MQLSILIVIISLVLLSGCINQKATISENAIEKLLEQYPQLSKNYEGKTMGFKLTRKIIDNNFLHELELYSATDSFSYNQIIIGIKNNIAFALPIFSPEQADYWNMDSIYKRDIKNPVNITFERELKKLSEMMQFQKKSNKIIFFREIFQHLLRCYEVPMKSENYGHEPIEIEYDGNYRFYIQLFQNNEFRVRAEEIIGCGFQY